jgi:hypothetical protein
MRFRQTAQALEGGIDISLNLRSIIFILHNSSTPRPGQEEGEAVMVYLLPANNFLKGSTQTSEPQLLHSETSQSLPFSRLRTSSESLFLHTGQLR